ncbi:hypothetical protein PVL30_004896 [Lodderomyces elongisporus]|uniref:uncharacterized protein n=1 Tax=Lodderomyces elongisporus TaxID=36914 RepID=UPI002920400A|nr:uncharacterized protein PVL30_004896 [Lodderomyces elongisporus]WLF81100.1 hypothetical protein PVL30_004896 [Lodderomyces elongisporus]
MPAATTTTETETANTIKESYTDVLIIGAGPSGYMCALWLARCGIPFRIIDKRSNEIFTGQADGIQSRSFEIFKSFSEDCFDWVTMDQAWKCANQMEEMSFWSPNEDGELARTSRVPDSIPGISRYHESVIHQGKIEAWFDESIKQFTGGKTRVERPLLPVSIKINADANDQQEHACEVLVRKLHTSQAKPEQYGGQVANGLYRQFDGDQESFYSANIADADKKDYELIHAKYVLGSDGAHSWVRKQLDIDMEGEQTDFVWGVLDMVPITDFPDIRSRCAIHSKNSGSVMVIPRENDMVRLYIQLKEVPRDERTIGSQREFMANCDDPKVKTKGRIDRSKITPESILKQAQESIKPFKLEMTNLTWYTAYQIGQRVSPQFHKNLRVFISGDACHTHSPKAGQGMNVSMQDTYNLGFKLALVCKGLAKQEILDTYESERIKVARDLIAFDQKFSKLFSGKPMIPNQKLLEGEEKGADMDEFHQVFLQGGKFASGTISDYEDSVLINKAGGVVRAEGQESEGLFSPLASKVPIGRRLLSVQALGQVDHKPWHIADRMPSDGRFRVLIFAGDVKHFPENMQKLQSFNEILMAPGSFLNRYTPRNAFFNSVIEAIVIHASFRNDVEFYDFPEFARRRDFKGRTDYWSLLTGVGKIHHTQEKVDMYDAYGIDKRMGAILVIRPDGHVAEVNEFSETGLNQVCNYFSRFMIDQRNVKVPEKDATAFDSDRFVKPRLAV